MIDLLKGIFPNQDKKKTAKEIADADKALNLTGDIARKCLSHEDFKMYRESYERTEKSTVDALISYTKLFVESPTGDITKYALTTMRLLTKLQDLRYLVKSIESDSKKGLDNEKPRDQK